MAAVTRLLLLSGFPSSLKTKDIQTAFSDYENVNGGFKIKWRDDTSLLVVFADATIGELELELLLCAIPDNISSQAGILEHDCFPSCRA